MHLVLDVGFWVHLGLVRFDVLMGVNVLVRMMILSVVMSIWVRTRKLFQVLTGIGN